MTTEGLKITIPRAKIDLHTAQRAATFAALGAAFLALSKLGVYWFSGSLIVVMAAADSVGDCAISLLNRFVIKYARSDDDTHPYGRGKAESIAALSQGALLLGGAGAILVACVQRLISVIGGQKSTDINWFSAVFFIGAALFSLVITVGLDKAAKRHNSPALTADAEHYRMDVLTNLGSGLAIAAIILTNKEWLDPLMAGAFAVYTAFGGLKLVRSSLAELMDADLPEEMKHEALGIIMETSAIIIDIHNFRGRRSGHRAFFDFHLSLPSSLPFFEVHEIIELIEDRLKNRFGGDCIIHADPDCLPISPAEKIFANRRKTE